MRFVISRENWLRGEGAGESRLLRESDGKMCCMGQACLQIGLTPAQILDIRSVSSSKILRRKGDSAEFLDHTRYPRSWVFKSYNANDCAGRDEPREASLTEIFASGGHELIFVDTEAQKQAMLMEVK